MNIKYFILLLFFFVLAEGCRSPDQSIPITKFVVRHGDHEQFLDEDLPFDHFSTEGEIFSWIVYASDKNRIQSTSFFYKNLELDFPDGLKGIDTVRNAFYVGEQKVHQIIFNFNEYNPNSSVSGVAELVKDSGAVLGKGSFYNITSTDLDIPRNHSSKPLTLSVN